MNTISRTKALKMMQDSKGKFFTAVFTKKDGTDRTINGQWLKDQKMPHLGYVAVRDAILGKRTNANIRNVNLQTLKTLKVSGNVYKIK